jgi:hypothetical protein
MSPAGGILGDQVDMNPEFSRALQEELVSLRMDDCGCRDAHARGNGLDIFSKSIGGKVRQPVFFGPCSSYMEWWR